MCIATRSLLPEPAEVTPGHERVVERSVPGWTRPEALSLGPGDRARPRPAAAVEPGPGWPDRSPRHTEAGADKLEMTDGQHKDPLDDAQFMTILLYASDRTTRENVRLTLGRKVAADLPPVRVLEVATQPAVLTAMDAGGVDLAILDGEAVPGGMGLCRQLKDEIFPCPPILVLIGRRDDAWLATWSRADGAVCASDRSCCGCRRRLPSCCVRGRPGPRWRVTVESRLTDAGADDLAGRPRPLVRRSGPTGTRPRPGR